MTGQALTIADIQFMIGMIAAIAGLWWRVEHRISSGAKDALAKALEVEKELHAYKLEVAKSYATTSFIKDVENRLGARFDSIVTELHGMRTDLQQALVNFAEKSPRHPR